MFEYRGVKVRREIFGGAMTASGKLKRFSRYSATVDADSLAGGRIHNISGSTEDEICNKIDEILGPDESATQD